MSSDEHCCFCEHNLILCECTICGYNSQCLIYNTSQQYLDFTDIDLIEEDNINLDQEIEIEAIKQELENLLELSTMPILDSPDSGKCRRIVDGDNTRETLHNGNNSTMEINKYNGTTPTNDKNDNDSRIGQQPGHTHYQHKFTNIERENIAKTFKPIGTIPMDTVQNIHSITEPTREHDDCRDKQ